MEYRLGTKKDINNIWQLIQAAIETMERHGIHQWDELYPIREDFEEDIDKQTLYVVYEGDDLVAIYVISTECNEAYKNGTWENADETAYILHRFCVNPNHQNRGIGKTVLLYIENQIKNMGYESIRLDVYTKNPYAQKLYLHHGYEARGFADWRKGRFALMEKKL